MSNYSEEKQNLIDRIICAEQGCMDTYAYQEMYYDIRNEQLHKYTLEEIEEWRNDDDPDKEYLE